MKILNAIQTDIPIIFELYQDATDYQIEKKVTLPWAGFKKALIEQEINEGRLFKITEKDMIACVFSVAFTDPLIWKEKEAAPSVYLHRIAVNKDFRGRKYVSTIIEWTKDYGKKLNKKFIRLDTNHDNYPLLDYYKKAGFKFMGNVKPSSTKELPKHYETITLATFEMKI